MHINFKFGKRDQKKYKEAIEFLEGIDEGDRSRVCKQALLAYAQSMQNGNVVPNVIPNVAPMKPNVPQQEEDDYIEVKTNEKQEEDVEVPGIDDFLGG